MISSCLSCCGSVVVFGLDSLGEGFGAIETSWVELQTGVDVVG